jgi:hypothetical protein
MKLKTLRSVAASCTLALAAAAPAIAGNVDFEDVLPTLNSAGVVATSGGLVFTSDGFGFSGVDSAVAFSSFGNAPSNAQGQFLFALNTDGITVTNADGGGLMLGSVDVSFIAPVGGLGAGIEPGELYVVGTESGTGALLFDTFAFPASTGNGDFAFTSVTFGGLAGRYVSEVSFFACVYDSTGFCSFADPTAQFALDNISYIPTPASLALVIGALGLLAATRRRSQAV